MRKIGFLLWCFSSFLYADWNEDFDRQSQELIQRIPPFQQKEFSLFHAFFFKIRETILQDQGLRRKVGRTGDGEKWVVVNSEREWVLKKRRSHNIKEAYAWELAYLLGGKECLLPSFPFEMEGRKVILQKRAFFAIGQKSTKVPRREHLSLVNLETYWKAHIIAYILGMRDLVGRNIGIDGKGRVLFFDAEDSLNYFNEVPLKEGRFFSLPFNSQAMDWPHYRYKLSSSEAKRIRDFIDQLSTFETYLPIYMEIRQLNLQTDKLLSRLRKVQEFSLGEGCRLRDFYGFLFPKMNEGLGQLRDWACDLLEREVDHGGALYHATGQQISQKMTDREYQKLKQWIERYVQ